IIGRTDMTKQEASFDYVNDMCKYLTSDGKKCAVGQLIPDNLYIEELEGKIISDGDGDIVSDLIEKLGHDIHLASDLQKVHDTLPDLNGSDTHIYQSGPGWLIDAIGWEEGWRRVAARHGLIYTP